LALDIMEGQALSAFIGPLELSLTQDDILIYIWAFTREDLEPAG